MTLVDNNSNELPKIPLKELFKYFLILAIILIFIKLYEVLKAKIKKLIKNKNSNSSSTRITVLEKHENNENESLPVPQ